MIKREEFKILYKAEVDSWIRRKDTYRSNVGRAYALLYERCNKAMQTKLLSRKDFTSMKGDPFKLLDAIKAHSVSYQENKYPMNSITDAIRNLVNLKQKEDESLIDYGRCFKVARDVFKSQVGGPLVLTPIAEKIQGYDEKDPDKVKECREEAYQQWLAYVYISNADHAKYGTLLSGLSGQFALGQDQYPKTLVDATNVLSNHHFDPAQNARRSARQIETSKSLSTTMKMCSIKIMNNARHHLRSSKERVGAVERKGIVQTNANNEKAHPNWSGLSTR